MRYLIINEDHTVEQWDTLSGNLRGRARRGEITLIDTKEMRGLNGMEYAHTHGEWSDVPIYSRPVDEPPKEG